MMPINISMDDLIIRNLENNELLEAYKCINQKKENFRTLGRTSEFSFDDIKQRYLETLLSSLEFFCGIFYKENIIGIIKGRMEVSNHRELCLLSFILLEEYRGSGMGSKILVAFEDYFYYNFSVDKFCAMIMYNNKKINSFWIKNGYEIKRVTKGTSDDNSMGMMILEKGRD